MKCVCVCIFAIKEIEYMLKQNINPTLFAIR